MLISCKKGNSDIQLHMPRILAFTWYNLLKRKCKSANELLWVQLAKEKGRHKKNNSRDNKQT